MNTSAAKKIVSESVRRAVRYCGTQTALAKKADITQGAVGKYLREEALPTGVTAKKLAEAVDNTQSKEHFAPHIFGEPEQESAA
jgi:transcriptional regulator with XRE-family HTH domain